ncbi:MAG: thioredoxin fold domain-containing protein [Bacteroidota bacterium]
MTMKVIIGASTLALIAAIAFWPGSSSSAEGDWLSYSEAIQKAGGTKRIVLVDVYTDWCGWCKKMDRDVYADKDVQAVLGEYFVTAKLDAESATKHPFQGESATEREIAKSFGITGYPTTLFLTEDGEAITILPGYIPKETFLQVLSYIHTRAYETQSWEEFVKNQKS